LLVVVPKQNVHHKRPTLLPNQP